MSDIELTDVDKVGPKRAETLSDEGYDVTTLASVSAETVSDATGFDLGVAETIVENAVEAYYGDEDDSGEKSDVSADVGSEDGESSSETGGDDSDNTGDDDTEDGIPTPLTFDPSSYVDPEDDEVKERLSLLDIEMSAELLQHIIHVQLEEATKKTQSNRFGLRDDAFSTARKLMAVSVQGDDPVEATVALSQPEVVSLFRATSQGSSDYASRSGIPSMWAEIESFSDEVNEIRE